MSIQGIAQHLLKSHNIVVMRYLVKGIDQYLLKLATCQKASIQGIDQYSLKSHYFVHVIHPEVRLPAFSVVVQSRENALL